MFETQRPTQEELEAWHREEEADGRKLAIELVEKFNKHPNRHNLTYGDLAKLMNVHLEKICSVFVSRIDYAESPLRLLDPEGRRVCQATNKISNELGEMIPRDQS